MSTNTRNAWSFLSGDQPVQETEVYFSSSDRPLSDEELLDAYSRAVVGFVEKVRPAVVSISTESQMRSRGFGNEEPGQGWSLLQMAIC